MSCTNLFYYSSKWVENSYSSQNILNFPLASYVGRGEFDSKCISLMCYYCLRKIQKLYFKWTSRELCTLLCCKVMLMNEQSSYHSIGIYSSGDRWGSRNEKNKWVYMSKRVRILVSDRPTLLLLKDIPCPDRAWIELRGLWNLR